MAFVYHAFFHVLTENGNKTLVTEQKWGQARLTGDDLTKFNADMEEAYAPFFADLNAGKILVSDLTEEITTDFGQKITVTIGDKVTFLDATSKYEFSTKFNEWATLMKQDPNLSYVEPVWADETP